MSSLNEVFEEHVSEPHNKPDLKDAYNYLADQIKRRSKGELPLLKHLSLELLAHIDKLETE